MIQKISKTFSKGKISKIIEDLIEYLNNSVYIQNANQYSNSLLYYAKPMNIFSENTGKNIEDFTRNAISYRNLENCLANNYHKAEANWKENKYFYKVESEPLGKNEFPDYRVLVGEVDHPKKDLIDLYIENKSYTSSFKFGLSALDSLLDNILTKYGETLKLSGEIKKIDKLTTPVLIESIHFEDLNELSKKLKIDDICCFSFYELLRFNKNNGLTTKSLKSLIVIPVSSKTSMFHGTVNDWLEEFRQNIVFNSNELIERQLKKLSYSKEEVNEIILDRMKNPIFYQSPKTIEVLANPFGL